jgi:hypothetical protein
MLLQGRRLVLCGIVAKDKNGDRLAGSLITTQVLVDMPGFRELLNLEIP